LFSQAREKREREREREREIFSSSVVLLQWRLMMSIVISFRLFQGGSLGVAEGLEVSALGLGCMGMTGVYGAPNPEEEMIELIRYVVHSGVTFLDTADL
jgi:hypothetical protein